MPSPNLDNQPGNWRELLFYRRTRHYNIAIVLSINRL